MVWVQELYIFPEESLVTITDDLLSYHCRRKICEIAIRKVIKCNKFSLRVPSNSKSLCCKLKKKKIILSSILCDHPSRHERDRENLFTTRNRAG